MSSSSSSSKGKQKSLTSFFVGSETSKQAASSFSNRKRPRPSSGGSFRSLNGGSGFGVCPLCQVSFAWHVLESHASECTGTIQGSKVTTAAVGHPKGESTTAFQDANTSSNDKTPPKALLSTKTNEITPLANSDKQVSPNNTTPKERTKATATTTPTTTIINASNIVTPRLAPIFQAKKAKNSKDDGSNAMLYRTPPLQPHSYEPIPGLFVYEDFITEEEEALILKGCDAFPAWKHCRFNGKHIGKRWGVHCNLRDRRVDAPEHPLPDVLKHIIFPKLQTLGLPQTKNFWPNEANAIDYRKHKGDWLQAHVDDRRLSKEPIANLSLVGDCYMTFRNVGKHRNLAVAEQRVLLKRRCLQVLTGKARYDFSHGIANADLLSPRRISITMRESPLTNNNSRTRVQK